MKSAEAVFEDVAKDTDIEQFDQSVKDEIIGRIRSALADAVSEGRQVLRKCWQDFDKRRGTTAEYHVMVAKAIEARANEIKEGK